MLIFVGQIEGSRCLYGGGGYKSIGKNEGFWATMKFNWVYMWPSVAKPISFWVYAPKCGLRWTKL